MQAHNKVSKHYVELDKVFENSQGAQRFVDNETGDRGWLVRGEITVEQENYRVVTAIVERPSQMRNHYDTEFTTNVGQTRDTPLGRETIGVLNHNFKGKFVTFESEEPDTLDVVYSSRQPSDWINRDRVLGELQAHGQTQAIVEPILRTVNAHENRDLTNYEARELTTGIVEQKLGMSRSWNSPPKYHVEVESQLKLTNREGEL